MIFFQIFWSPWCYCTCLGLLGRHNRDRIISIFVTSPKVAKASTIMCRCHWHHRAYLCQWKHGFNPKMIFWEYQPYIFFTSTAFFCQRRNGATLSDPTLKRHVVDNKSASSPKTSKTVFFCKFLKKGAADHRDCTGSAITNGREPRSCLGRVFNSKLGCIDTPGSKCMVCMQPLLKLKTRPKARPVS